MEFTPRCPTCRALVRWNDNPDRPFCSERCRLRDLGAWVTEQYRIPSTSSDADGEDGDGDSNGDDVE